MPPVHPGLVGRPIYLDYNATTPIDPEVVAAMEPYLSREFGNPSSTHSYGARARAALIEARDQVGALIHAPAGRIVFTGSGSEADALAIRGAVLANRRDGRRPHVITQTTEHPAVLAACRELEELHGARVTVLPVDTTGRIDPSAVAEAITEDTILVTVMHANNETGTIQPIADIAALAHERGVLVHCDAAQSIGKLSVDVQELGVDLLTVVGHKMYAPKGVSALYIGNGAAVRPLIGGGSQEFGLRSGTENVPYAVGLGQAASLASTALAAGETGRLATLRDRLESDLHTHLPGRIHLNGHPTQRLPNTLNIRIDGLRALTFLADTPAIAASTGSACHAGRDEPSPVLTAMHLPATQAHTALRLSIGRWTTETDIDQAAQQIASAARA